MKALIFILQPLFITQSFNFNHLPNPSISEIGVKTIKYQPQGYDIYSVYATVKNYDHKNPNHHRFLENFTKRYCSKYRDGYFSLYFYDVTVDLDKLEKDEGYEKEMKSNMLAWADRNPDHPLTGEVYGTYLYDYAWYDPDGDGLSNKIADGGHNSSTNLCK